MALTNTDVDSAVPVAGVPTRALVNAALKTLITDVAGKAVTGHTHNGLAPTGGTSGQVLKKNSGTDYDYSWQTDSGGAGATNLSFTRDADSVSINSDTGNDADIPVFTSSLAGVVPSSGGGTSNFLRADGTWAAPAGGGGTLTVEEGDSTVVSGATNMDFAAADFDVTAAGTEANVAISTAIPRILAPVTLSSNTSLTAASHGNRTIYVDTAGLTLTINNDATGGWATDDVLDIQAVGSGTFTLVQGSATLTTDSGCSADSTTSVAKRVQAQRIGTSAWRTTSASIATGSGNVKAYRSVGSFVAPTSSGESSDLTTLNIEPLSANGDFVEGHVRLESGNEAAESSTIRVYLNGAIVYQATVENNTRSYGFKFWLERMSDTSVRCAPAFTAENLNPSSSVWNDVTVTSLSAGATLAIRHSRAATQTKTVTYRRLSATVERA